MALDGLAQRLAVQLVREVKRLAPVRTPPVSGTAVQQLLGITTEGVAGWVWTPSHLPCYPSFVSHLSFAQAHTLPPADECMWLHR